MTDIGVKNIMGVYYLSKESEKVEGVAWYKNAHNSCKAIARKYKTPLRVVVGVCSALSPNNKWGKNKVDAENIVHAYKSGIPLEQVRVSTYDPNKQKAKDMLEYGKIPKQVIRDILFGKSGYKTRAFFDCIHDCKTNKDTVCVDGHAFNIYMGERNALNGGKVNMTPKKYLTISQAYIDACDEINKREGTSYLPYQIQAITWVAWRRIHGIT
mgnify:CR=1 FL=1